MMRCPRRMEMPINNYNKLEDTDVFLPSAGLVNQPSGCSFCGSMDPVDFLNAMRNGCELGPTDKNYKVYVKHEDWHGKFYFMHLSEDQMGEFIDIYNRRPRTFTFGYPGHFYVKPYFVAYGPAPEGGNE